VSRARARLPHRARGISLPVVLILLLGMALVGAAVLQSGVLQTRMAAGLHAQHLAFEAAESALRAGEALASAAPTAPASGCSAGICATPAADAIERWKQPGFNGWRTLPGHPDDGVPAAEFFIEHMGQAPTTPGCEREQPVADTCQHPLYRITARSAGGTVLQSHYLGGRVSWREVIGN